MRIPHYLTRDGKSGLLYFRLRVPEDLAPTLGVAVIKRACRTRCPRAAAALSSTWSLAYSAAFDGLRRAAMDKDEEAAAKLLRDLGGIRRYEIAGPGGFRVRADGAEDHARALEAITRLGQLPPAMIVRAAPAAAHAPSAGKTLAAAMADYEEGLPAINTSAKTRGAKLAPVRAFVEWRGGQTRARTVTRQEVAKFRLSLVARLDGVTVDNQIGYLASFFDAMQSSGDFPKDAENPARGHERVTKKEKRKRAKTRGWQPFDLAQIQRIFAPANFALLPTLADRWMPLILLYTGARANEIARLELADFIQIDGVDCIDINLLGFDKGAKNEESERKVPLHPDLIALSLLEHVAALRAAGAAKLFPDLNFAAQNGPANAPGTAFVRYLRHLGVAARGKGRMGHHSFRDTAISTMKAARVPAEYRDAYTGHALDSRPDHRDAYETDLSPSALARVCHPALAFGLDLVNLRSLLALDAS